METVAPNNIERKQAVPQIVWDMVQHLVLKLRPERIYLFGSTARGDADADSDIDLMVVVRESSLMRYERAQQAHLALADFPVAKDVLVWTRDEFDSRTHLVASLPATIMREGVLLYAR